MLILLPRGIMDLDPDDRRETPTDDIQAVTLAWVEDQADGRQSNSLRS